AGATNSAYSYIPANADAITCLLTSNATCPSGNPATSNIVTMTVNPILPVSVTIAASANPVCAGTSVTFTATPTNGGTTPVYQWKKGGTNIAGATNATYSYIPANADAITCLLTSNATCPSGNPATSNIVTMTVNPILPVSVTIATSANPVCAGTSVTFTATPTNGGTTPLYQWKKSGTDIAGATNATYSYIPANADAITCLLTSNATCPSGNPATSNTVTMTVNPILPVSVTISASANPVSNGTTVIFTATPSNGGSTPLYQWKVNAMDVGSNNAVYSYIPVNGDEITCILTSNLACVTGNPATSNTIVMTVTGIPINTTVTGTVTGTVCYNATQTINVAGGATTFIVQTGGNVTMIAGQNIHYFQGTKVDPGGYMIGKIAPGGPYCGGKTPSIATVATGEEELSSISVKSAFKVYPNPTTGTFIVELTAANESETNRIEICGMRGEKILSKDLSIARKHEFSLSGMADGIYFIRVIFANGAETIKIIKQ
ncbi:MAG: T9SS type A sorting domain-containing protein, partial [Bacteroidetes bacterium]|nr:T9SS type A sorting domain-containing protein [Bacteroidota bacterium]